MKCKLSDICCFVNEKILVSSLTTFTYISTENMLPNRGGIVEASTLPSISLTQAFKRGDVLVSNIRPYFKKIWQASFDGGCSNDVLVFRANKQVDANFLYYVLATDDFFNYATGTSKGTKMPRGDKVAIMQYSVPNLSLSLQKKIAKILSSLDDKIELNNAINNNLQQQAQAIFKSWFIDFEPFGGKMPDDWKVVTLEQITTLISRGISPKYIDDSDQMVLNQKCIRNHMIDLSLARNHIPKVVNEKWIRFGDLLINSTGDGTLGRVAQVWFKPKNLTVDSHITVVRPANRNLNFYVGFWAMAHEKEIEALHTGSTGQTELPRGRVKEMKLFLPDNFTLSNYNVLISPITANIISNLEENNNLKLIRDTLLPKLMSGQLDISEIEI